MRKIIPFLTALAIVITVTCGCVAKQAAIDPNTVLAHLLSDIQYDAPLSDAGEFTRVYFPGLPEQVEVRLYASSSGYFPDEVAMFTLSDISQRSAVLGAINEHLSQLRTQFQNYIPEEVATIDAAVIREFDTTIFLVITGDHASASSLFERAHNLTPAPLPVSPAIPNTEIPTEPSAPSTTPPETLPPETVPTTTEPSIPTPPVLQSESGTYTAYSSGVIRVDNHAFEPYGFDPYVAGTYARLVNSVATDLAGYTTVYCMPVPTAISVMLPDDIQAIYPYYRNQGKDIETIFSKMNSNVIGINCYDNLMLHRDEYLYFRTDYHWNGPAAYYAYESFCEAIGQTPYTMEERFCSRFDGFLGLLYTNSTRQDPALAETPDTVLAYHPYFGSAYMFYEASNGEYVDHPIIADATSWSANSKYLCFAAADQPYAEFHNPDIYDDSVLIVVKESYGNALMPFLVDHFSTIYEIDYRFWQGDLVDFAMSVGATDLLFVNNVTMISAGVLVGMLSNIIP